MKIDMSEDIFYSISFLVEIAKNWDGNIGDSRSKEYTAVENWLDSIDRSMLD